MYYVGMVYCFGIIGCLVIDWSRFRELLPATLTGLILAGTLVALPGLDLPYRLLDSTPLGDHWAITFALQMTVAPVISAWFAQGLPRHRRFPLGRILLFTLLLHSLQLMSAAAGKLAYAPWWEPAASCALAIASFSLIAHVHFYTTACSSPHHRGDRAAREVRVNGVLSAPGPSDMAAGPLDS